MECSQDWNIYTAKKKKKQLSEIMYFNVLL